MQHVAANAIRAFREAVSFLMFAGVRHDRSHPAARTAKPKKTTKTV
jgi:hypothetical protein